MAAAPGKLFTEILIAVLRRLNRSVASCLDWEWVPKLRRRLFTLLKMSRLTFVVV